MLFRCAKFAKVSKPCAFFKKNISFKKMANPHNDLIIIQFTSINLFYEHHYFLQKKEEEEQVIKSAE
jgi:hypothetical protein